MERKNWILIAVALKAVIPSGSMKAVTETAMRIQFLRSMEPSLTHRRGLVRH